MACHHHSHQVDNHVIQYLLETNVFGIHEIWVILALFVYGVIGSFTHCIGMCGPIALGQMNMRIMHLKKDQLNNFNKLNCALSLPYYFGKAFTYGILALITKYLANSLSSNVFLKYIIGVILIISALTCLKLAILKFKKFTDIPIKLEIFKYLKFLENFVSNAVQKLSLNPFGFQGFIMGMALGLIPCGLVISAIMITSSYSNNIFAAFLCMFFFGLGTFPALFLISYFGQHVILRFKNYIDIIFSIFMFLNFLLLLNFAIRLF